MAKPPAPPRGVSSPVLTSRPPPDASSKSAASKPAPSSHAAAQFHRFRLSEFNRDASASLTTAAAPAGQCSRFRVSDFVPSPWTSDTPTHTPTTPVAVSPVMNGRSAGQSPAGGGGARQGSFSVMHMDVDGAGPQQTSSSVAAAAGSGRGVLQKVAVAPVQQQGVQKMGANPAPRPLAPSPLAAHAPSPKIGFEPSSVPQEAVWELSRILSIFRQLPPDTIIAQISDALLKWPSLHEGSLLRRIGEIFPSPAPPPPAATAPTAPAQDQTRKKRGRPPGKKAKLNDGSSAPIPIAANPIGLAAMAPPPVPVPYVPPVLAPAPATTAPMPQRGKPSPDKMVSCTRCLKPFNPTWRATPASDPSSEATCAVKHPYKGFEAGLEAVTLPRRKNNYKTTWKWKCCGREVQSTSEQLLLWPRKEDDRTGGWCFVGKHTTEPGVREKLGLKPGKGKRISDEIAKKRKKGGAEVLVSTQAHGNACTIPGVDASKGNWALSENVDLVSVANGNMHAGYGIPQAQQHSPPSAYAHTDSAPTSDDPPKRKRGRPKGSKTRSKIMQMAMPTSTKETTSVTTGVNNTGPEQQLMNEASPQHTHLTHNPGINADSDVVQDQNSFWTQYTEPNLSIDDVDDDEEQENDSDDAEEAEDDEDPADDSQDQDDSEDPAISTADLSLLASATAAMSAPQEVLPEDAPEKRKRGRPKGSRNGKMTIETPQKALRMKPTPGAVGDLAVQKNVAPPAPVNKNIPVPVPDPVVTGTDEGAPFVGMGAMDYGGLGSGDGGGWFG